MIVCLDLVRVTAFRPAMGLRVPQNITATTSAGKQVNHVMRKDLCTRRSDHAKEAIYMK